MLQSAVELHPLAADEADTVESRRRIVDKMFIEIVSLCPRSAEDVSSAGRRVESATHHQSD